MPHRLRDKNSALPRLVIATLKETAPDRRCFRKISGVLVERTVAEVLPAIETQRAGVGALCCVLQANNVQISQYLQTITTEHNKIDETLSEMKKKYKIRTEQDQDQSEEVGAAKISLLRN